MELNISQAELAKMAGVTRQTIGMIEAGTFNPSLKLCLCAEGTADVYPRLAPTMHWDTAAAQAIVAAAGGRVTQYGTEDELAYGGPSLVNPYFVVTRPGFRI